MKEKNYKIPEEKEKLLAVGLHRLCLHVCSSHSLILYNVGRGGSWVKALNKIKQN